MPNTDTPQTTAADQSQLQDFVGLPLKDLIVEPLIASAKGQQDLAQVTLDFIKQVGFTQDANGNTSLRTVDIDVPRLIEGETSPLMQRVSMPLIAMVTIPNLAVDSVDIDFTIEVQSQTNNTTENDNSTDSSSSSSDKNENTAGGGANDIFWSITDKNTNTFKTSKTITGKVAAKSSNTRSTDFSAKYDISVHASQQRPSEGMSKLTQIIASCIEPINLVTPKN